jgi:hypothetical protein
MLIGSPILSAPTKLPRTEFCIVKRTCEISDVPHLSPFAKLPETLCCKPYFHIYHIISHFKKIVKALHNKNLDYLYSHFTKRIVKSDNAASLYRIEKDQGDDREDRKPQTHKPEYEILTVYGGRCFFLFDQTLPRISRAFFHALYFHVSAVVDNRAE